MKTVAARATSSAIMVLTQTCKARLRVWVVHEAAEAGLPTPNQQSLDRRGNTRLTRSRLTMIELGRRCGLPY